MIIQKKVYDKLLYGFPTVPPEAGAILGMKNGVVNRILIDYGVVCIDRAAYTPSTVLLNSTIAIWIEKEIQFCGIAHSHPVGQEQLSSSDIQYINRIMMSMPDTISQLFFPLVFPGEKILPFLAIRQSAGLEILLDNIILI